jgi:hypothetical protein
LHALPNNIGLIKSRETNLSGPVAYVEEKINE